MGLFCVKIIILKHKYNRMTKETLFESLWNQYTERTPSAEGIRNLFVQEGNVVKNDHIAIRTFNDKRVGIEVLSKAFVKLGYEHKGTYHFEAKKLNAHHFELVGDSDAPRVFISELLLEEFDESLQNEVSALIDQISQEDLEAEDLILKGRLWEKPSYKRYTELLEVSEYAAWMYINGFCANHFTVAVNDLTTMQDLPQVNEFLKMRGFKMNTSGGEIKGSKELMLEQSSVLADRIEMEFVEGKYEVTSCYYEFAYRYPMADGTLFSGFVAGSADKIFESTNMKVS